jgi:hypothetical protein
MSAVEKRASSILGGAAAVMSAEPTPNLRFRPNPVVCAVQLFAAKPTFDGASGQGVFRPRLRIRAAASLPRGTSRPTPARIDAHQRRRATITRSWAAAPYRARSVQATLTNRLHVWLLRAVVRRARELLEVPCMRKHRLAEHQVDFPLRCRLPLGRGCRSSWSRRPWRQATADRPDGPLRSWSVPPSRSSTIAKLDSSLAR